MISMIYSSDIIYYSLNVLFSENDNNKVVFYSNKKQVNYSVSKCKGALINVFNPRANVGYINIKVYIFCVSLKIPKTHNNELIRMIIILK